MSVNNRISVGFSDEDFDKLNRVAEISRVSTRVVISALLGLPEDKIVKLAVAVRDQATQERKAKKMFFDESRRKVKKMTPDQIRKIEEILNAD